VANESLMAQQMQKEEDEYVQKVKNLPVANYPSLTGMAFDYGMGYLGRNPQTLRSSYAQPFTSKAEVMGSNFRNAMNNLDSFSFDSLKEFFSEATTSPLKTLVPDPKSRGE
jgi:hypothetical protein